MEVAVAGVEDVGDLDLVAGGDVVDLVEDVGEAGAGHDAVQDVVVGLDVAEAADGALAAGPKALAVRGFAGDADLAGLEALHDGLDGGALGVDLGGGAVDFDDEDGFGVEGEAGVEDGFDGGDGLLVDHFEGGGDDAGLHDGADGVAGLADGVKDGEEGADGFGLGEQLDADLGDDADRALAADDAADEVVAGALAVGAADPLDLAVGGDELKAEDVVGGGAVGEAVGAAGVLGGRCRRWCRRAGCWGRACRRGRRGRRRGRGPG